MNAVNRGAHPIDPGVQAERTLLAWRRTCLALALGFAGFTHVFVEQLGVAAVLVGLIGLGAVAAAWSLPMRRYRRWRPHLTAEPTGLRLGSLPLAAMTAATLLAGATALVAVLV